MSRSVVIVKWLLSEAFTHPHIHMVHMMIITPAILKCLVALGNLNKSSREASRKLSSTSVSPRQGNKNTQEHNKKTQ